MSAVNTGAISTMHSPLSTLDLQLHTIRGWSISKLISEIAQITLAANADVTFNNQKAPILAIQKLESTQDIRLQNISATALWEVITSISCDPLLQVTLGKAISVSQKLLAQFISYEGALPNCWESVLPQDFAPNTWEAQQALSSLLKIILFKDFSTFDRSLTSQQLLVLKIATYLEIDLDFTQEIIKRIKNNIVNLANAEQLIVLYKLAADYQLFNYPELAKGFDTFISKIASTNIAQNHGCFSVSCAIFLLKIRQIRVMSLLDLSGGRINLDGLKQLEQMEIHEPLCLSLDKNITDTDLSYVAKFTSLQHLNLSECHITDAGLQHLTNLSFLQYLDLSLCHITDAGLQHLTNFSFLQNLYLENVSELTGTGLQHLANLKLLHNLSLQDCRKLTREGLQSLATLTSLQQLDLTGCSITDADLQYISSLSSLQHLDLSWCSNITGSGLQYVAKLTSLKSLDMSNCYKLTDEGLKHAETLTSLTHLHLLCCSITDIGLLSIGKITSLQHLNIGMCAITDAGLQNLNHLSSLQYLDMWMCVNITDEGMLTLSRLTSLRYLKLSGCGITGAGLHHLSHLPSLNHLDLSDCYQITDAGLQPLFSFTNLQVLDLSRCSNIIGTSFIYLSNLSNLQVLNLRCCNIADHSLRDLSDLISLEHLNLSYCYHLTFLGLQYLANLPSLNCLDLRGCPNITDEGLNSFTRMKSTQTILTNKGALHSEKRQRLA